MTSEEFQEAAARVNAASDLHARIAVVEADIRRLEREGAMVLHIESAGSGLYGLETIKPSDPRLVQAVCTILADAIAELKAELAAL